MLLFFIIPLNLKYLGITICFINYYLKIGFYYYHNLYMLRMIYNNHNSYNNHNMHVFFLLWLSVLSSSIYMCIADVYLSLLVVCNGVVIYVT